MRSSDICEGIAVRAIENVFFGEWKHEGVICGCSYRHINFEIDGKEYVLVLHEVTEGHHFSEFLEG
jgi:hypothetical protein